MQFSDATDEQGLYQDAKDRVGAYSDADFPIKQFTRFANRYLKKATKIAMEASGVWRYFDSNNSETYLESNIVSGTDTYAIADTGLQIYRVEAKNSDGDFVRLKRVNLQELDEALPELSEDSSNPTHYYLQGNNVVLYPNPDYNSTDGLRVYVDSEPSLFEFGDTTKEPGFTSLYHEYCSIGPAYDYSVIHALPQKDELKQELREIEVYLAEFYSSRVDDGPIRLKSGVTNTLR